MNLLKNQYFFIKSDFLQPKHFTTIFLFDGIPASATMMFKFVLNGHELDNKITFGEAVVNYGLQDGNTLSLWAYISAAGKVKLTTDSSEISSKNEQDQIIKTTLKQRVKNLASKITKFIRLRLEFLTLVNGISMSGKYEHGQKVVTKKVWRFTRYNKGETIVFKIGNKIVIHDIIGTKMVDGELQYRTQGKNNNEPDPWTVPRADIIGKVTMSQADLNKLLLRVEQGKTTLEIALGMAVQPILTQSELSTNEGKLLDAILNLFPPNYITSRKQFAQILFGDEGGNELKLLDNFLEHPETKSYTKLIRSNLGQMGKDVMNDITKGDIGKFEFIQLKRAFPQLIGEYNDKKNFKSRTKEEYTRYYFEKMFGDKFEKNAMPKWYVKAWKEVGGDPNKISPLDGYCEALGLVFEYNGPHHELKKYKDIDAIKSKAIAKAKKTLITLTYKDSEINFQDIIENRYFALEGQYPPNRRRINPNRAKLFTLFKVLNDNERS